MPARRRIQQSGASVTTFCTKHRTSRHQSVFTQLCLGLRSANTNRHETQFLRPRSTSRAATSGLRIRRCEILRSRRRGRCSPWDEKVRILAFMSSLLRDSRFAIFCGTTVSGSPESHSKFPFSERTTLLNPIQQLSCVRPSSSCVRIMLVPL